MKNQNNYNPEGLTQGPELAARAAIAVGFTGDALIDAIAIAGAESRWNPTVENRNSSATGLWQIAYTVWADSLVRAGILPRHHSRSSLHDPYVNARAAKFITKQPLADRHGLWSDWAVHPDSESRGFYTPNNDYSTFLEEAREALDRVRASSNLHISRGTRGLPPSVGIDSGITVVYDA